MSTTGKHVILYRDDGIDSRIVAKEFDSRGIRYIPIDSSWSPDSLPVVRRGSEMIRGLVGILACLDDFAGSSE